MHVPEAFKRLLRSLGVLNADNTPVAGGAPGGSTGQLQFKNSGVFGGVAGSAVNNTASDGATPMLELTGIGTSKTQLQLRAVAGQASAIFYIDTAAADQLFSVSSNGDLYVKRSVECDGVIYALPTNGVDYALWIGRIADNIYRLFINADGDISWGDGNSLTFVKNAANTTNGRQYTALANAVVPLSVALTAGQTGDAFQVKSSGGATLFGINKAGAVQPASLADAAAPNNSFYYSTDAAKLVYKDAGGVVNALY